MILYVALQSVLFVLRWYGGLIGLSSRLKLDFEDEPPDDDDGVAASDEEQEDDSDADSDEEGDAFEDAMENLTISDQPRLVAATA